MDPAMTTLLTERLGERASQDPLAAMLLQHFQRSVEEDDHEGAGIDELRRKLESATGALDRLRTELSAANAMATHVAKVLGACSSCWGLNLVCPRCLGSGGPGSQPPDINALVNWITPALHRAGLTTTKRSATQPETDHPEGASYACP
jgi:hypothetical protein